MERLTTKIDNIYVAKQRRLSNGDYSGNQFCLNKLGELEDLEEQGLLLKLPCKVGSLVYKIKKDLNQMKRETIEHNGHYYHRNIDVYFITQVTFEIEDIAELGKTIFLTRAEAEKALEKITKFQKNSEKEVEE